MSTLQATSHAASKIDELVDQQGEKSISIVMPTYEAGRQVKQNAIRFKNLLSQVVQEPVAQGDSEAEAEYRIQPLFDLTSDDNFCNTKVLESPSTWPMVKSLRLVSTALLQSARPSRSISI